MEKKKAFLLGSIVCVPWWISPVVQKSLEYWLTNWANIKQSETFLTDLQQRSLLENFIELEDLRLLDEMIKEYPKTPLQNHFLGIHNETIQLIKMYNQDSIHMISHFSTNLISFLILITFSIFGNKELLCLHSWVREFLSNLSDTIKAFLILLVTDFCIGFHSPHGWELMIAYIYKDFGFAHNDQIISGLVSTFPVILDTIFKYWIFRYLNRLSPSLVVIYHSLSD
uniref:Potassium/proton antiporter CemA n=1 Tax=Pharnaceum aurantium TaxID=2518628 RepID=A0A411L935_9CARY|nr:chloroplast envelope membrane protein [Pharnaceum aurantium]